MPKDKRHKSLKSLDALGTLHGVHHVKKSIWWKRFLFFITALFLLVTVASYLFAPDTSSIFICTLPLVLLAFVFLMMLRSAFLTGNDELRIYDDGFAYRSRSKTQTCRWEEIVHFQKHDGVHLLSVEKASGEMISFADDPLPEKQEIIRRFEERLIREGNGKRSGEWKEEWGEYREELSELQSGLPADVK